MAILATVMQGGAICAALLESALTALLYKQVRRYSAELRKLDPPRKHRPLRSTDDGKTSQGPSNVRKL
jgi:hypothetical protein